MGKRDLQKYLRLLTKAQLEDQIIDLYHRFKDVRVFYNFVFNPNENQLVTECKSRIRREYFPETGRKPKMRRSVAKKFIRHFKTLGVDNTVLADVMLYNLETAQSFAGIKQIRPDAFYKSMLVSFREAVEFIYGHGLHRDFAERARSLAVEAQKLDWYNAQGFAEILERYAGK